MSDAKNLKWTRYDDGLRPAIAQEAVDAAQKLLPSVEAQIPHGWECGLVLFRSTTESANETVMVCLSAAPRERLMHALEHWLEILEEMDDEPSVERGH